MTGEGTRIDAPLPATDADVIEALKDDFSDVGLDVETRLTERWIVNSVTIDGEQTGITWETLIGADALLDDDTKQRAAEALYVLLKNEVEQWGFARDAGIDRRELGRAD